VSRHDPADAADWAESVGGVDRRSWPGDLLAIRHHVLVPTHPHRRNLGTYVEKTVVRHRACMKHTTPATGDSLSKQVEMSPPDASRPLARTTAVCLDTAGSDFQVVGEFVGARSWVGREMPQDAGAGAADEVRQVARGGLHLVPERELGSDGDRVGDHGGGSVCQEIGYTREYRWHQEQSPAVEVDVAVWAVRQMTVQNRWVPTQMLVQAGQESFDAVLRHNRGACTVVGLRVPEDGGPGGRLVAVLDEQTIKGVRIGLGE